MDGWTAKEKIKHSCNRDGAREDKVLAPAIPLGVFLDAVCAK